MNSKPTHTIKLEGLQVLRGVAALLVVWCHLKYNLGVPWTDFSKVPVLATDRGAMGVDIFFVISGFVIAMTATHFGNDWRTFLVQRIARVVPLYFAVSTCLFFFQANFGASHGASVPLSFSKIFNSYGFIPIFDETYFTEPVCVNGWTLCFEMWFYLSFAWLLKFVGGQRAGRVLPCMMAVCVIVVSVFYHSSFWFLPKFLFHPLVLEFSAGCVLYHARNLMGRHTLFALCLLAPCFLYFASRVEFLGGHQARLNDLALSFYRVLLWGGFSVCLVGAVTQIDLKYPTAWPKVLLLLGDASYSIYLIAPLVMLTVQAAIFWLNKIIGFEFLTMSPFLSGTVYILGTIFGGILVWKFFEVPATRKAKSLFARLLPKPV